MKDCIKEIYCKELCKYHYNQSYYSNNKNSILKQKKVYHRENKDSKKEYDKLYRLNNKDKILKDKYIYYNHRIKTDPVFKIRMNVSRAVTGFLKSNGSSKGGKSVLKYLEYSIEVLKVHLEKQFESWMSWENYGTYRVETWIDNNQSTWTWHIDHIIPQSEFPYTSMNEDNFKKCWTLQNLRPLSAKQNVIDGASKIRHNLLH